MRNQVIFNLINEKDNLEIERFSDPVRFKNVFQNLLNNAFFFTNEGFIRFGFEETESGIELFVEDSGCGIDESSKDLIFKPFFKGKNLIVGNKGFGLGLAISKGLVKLLGSDLQYTSTLNKGTRFYFRIDNKDIISRNPVPSVANEKTVKMKAISLSPIDKKLSQN